ncbi:MAG: High-affinity zinc uptake system protein ZnuA, partial [Alphaproteobacteria bacterium MarineAlpha12_Bin1]
LLPIISFLSNTASAKEDIHVLTSIKPVHSLVSLVMKGVGNPQLIVPGAASPHGFSLKPSQAKLMEKADIIFWIGPNLETFLEKPLQVISNKATKIKLIETPKLEKLMFRAGGKFEEHDHDHGKHEDEKHDDHGKHKDEKHDDHGKHKDEKHDDHGKHEDEKHDDHGKHEDEKHDDHGKHKDEKHDDHGKHKDEKHDDHGKHKDEKHDDHGKHKDEKHDDHGKHEDEKHDDHGHVGSGFDPHIWLDPTNAKLMLEYISHELEEIDPANARTYEKNSKEAKRKIDEVSLTIKNALTPYKENGFIVFHDAYQYFEKHFDLQASGAISIHPETVPGAQRMNEIRQALNNSSVKCVFTEPQFESKVVRAIIEGTGKKSVEIDPIGANLKPEKNLYFNLISDMGEAFVKCLR